MAGENVQKSRIASFVLRMPSEMHRELNRLAFEQTDSTGHRVSINELIIEALTEYLLKRRAKAKEGK